MASCDYTILLRLAVLILMPEMLLPEVLSPLQPVLFNNGASRTSHYLEADFMW